jgi:hypothetical protein
MEVEGVCFVTMDKCVGLNTLAHMRGSQELRRAGTLGLHKLSESEGKSGLGAIILTHEIRQNSQRREDHPTEAETGKGKNGVEGEWLSVLAY